MQDTEALAFRLYEQIITRGPADFGSYAIQACAEFLQADSAAWITWHRDSRNPGMFVAYNLPGNSLESMDVAACESLRQVLLGKVDSAHVATHELKKHPLLRTVLGLGDNGHCLAAGVTHRNGRLYSLLFFNREPGHPTFEREAVSVARALLPHMADAATLARRALISRDWLLQHMGRTSRGAPGLVDMDGGIYEADDDFIRLLTETYPGWDGRKLPLEFPEETEDTMRRELKFGSLRARTEQMGRLLLVHVRKLKPLDLLSRRERDVARGIVSGLTLKTIGQRLGISPSTVANHAARIYEKLNIHNRDQLVDIATNSARPVKKTGAVNRS